MNGEAAARGRRSRGRDRSAVAPAEAGRVVILCDRHGLSSMVAEAAQQMPNRISERERRDLTGVVGREVPREAGRIVELSGGACAPHPPPVVVALDHTVRRDRQDARGLGWDFDNRRSNRLRSGDGGRSRGDDRRGPERVNCNRGATSKPPSAAVTTITAGGNFFTTRPIIRRVRGEDCFEVISIDFSSMRAQGFERGVETFLLFVESVSGGRFS